MSDAITEYFEALERLIKNQPINVPVDTKISNDSVALEAKRNKGAIKKSRQIFADLILAIEVAAKDQKLIPLDSRKISKLQDEVTMLRRDLESALGRELSLVYEKYQLKKQLNSLIDNNVLTIRTKKT